MTPPAGLPLSALTALVERVRATSKKNEKIGLIADVLRQARGREAELLAMYLTGALPQGRIGLGWSTIHAALEGAPPPRDEPLALLDVDRAFGALAGERGAGSAERRTRTLRGLLERAREDERASLAALVLGEVQQGALTVRAGAARAAGLPATSAGCHVRAQPGRRGPGRPRGGGERPHALLAAPAVADRAHARQHGRGHVGSARAPG
jgi:DNA ligase-1